MPYVTAGMVAGWPEMLQACFDAGADAVEVGIPFSDPMLDGPVIQEASRVALERGTTFQGVLDGIASAGLPGPVAVMTYANLFFHGGYTATADRLAAAGVDAAIIPDLPLDEAGDWRAAARLRGIETVLLAAPSTPDDRLALICDAAEGFVYSLGVMGVTGERASLAGSATVLAKRCKALTGKPVLVGVGVSTKEQAVEACSVADGVIVGSALVRRVASGAGASEVARFVGDIRSALDARQ